MCKMVVQVVRGVVTRFSREQNEFDVPGQLFTELRKLLFVGDAKEMFNTIDAEVSDVLRIDSSRPKHVGDRLNGSDDNMRSSLQRFHSPVDASGPVDGEVKGDS